MSVSSVDTSILPPGQYDICVSLCLHSARHKIPSLLRARPCRWPLRRPILLIALSRMPLRRTGARIAQTRTVKGLRRLRKQKVPRWTWTRSTRCSLFVVRQARGRYTSNVSLSQTLILYLTVSFLSNLSHLYGSIFPLFALHARPHVHGR